jgi:hypothetical protein
LDLGCCPVGIAMPCPVHRHPFGGDRLEEAEREVSGGGGAHLTPVKGPNWLEGINSLI